jgi:hypothetical protein
MVRAILDGRKTQTRRVIKRELDNRGLRYCNEIVDWEDWHGIPVKCPYGQPGDRLWVRETFAFWDTFNDRKPSELSGNPGVEYMAGGTNLYGGTEPHLVGRGKWRPSIHMPRWASRINLFVKDIRVERVQDISEEDARAEGTGPLRSDGRMTNGFPASEGFADLWDSINEKRGYGWNKNPWVWVVEFEVIDEMD